MGFFSLVTVYINISSSVLLQAVPFKVRQLIVRYVILKPITVSAVSI